MLGNLGDISRWWMGVVVDVFDPHESGRVKVRVYGKHDDETNMPDEFLPWALPIQPVTSAAYSKIGTAPVGVVKGSKVIGLWADEYFQVPLIFGTLGKAGDPIEGEFENGAPKIDWDKGSAPAPSKNPEPMPYNPYAFMADNRIMVADIDAGRFIPRGISDLLGAIITRDVGPGMRFRNNPSMGAADPLNNCPVSKMLRDIDPFGINSSLKCLPGALDILKGLINMATNLSKAFTKLVVDAVKNAVLRLMQKLGIQKVLAFLNEIASKIAGIRALMDNLLRQACGLNPITRNVFSTIDLAIATALNGINTLAGIVYSSTVALANLSASATTAILNSIVTYPIASIATPLTPVPAAVVANPPPNYVRQYNAEGVDPYPGYITWVDPAGNGQPVYTPRNGEPNFISINQHSQWTMERYIFGPLESAILSGNLNGETFGRIVASAAQAGKSLVISMLLGIGFNIAGGIINATVNVPGIARALINDNKVIAEAATIVPRATQAVNNFIQEQALSIQRSERMRMLISNLPTLPGNCIL